MSLLLLALFRLLGTICASRASLVAENVALRQQLAILRRDNPRPRLRWHDRPFWVWLSRGCSGWRSWLTLVRPATVVGWHRRGFRLFGRGQSGGGMPGRPALPRDIVALIQWLARENPLGGAPHIRADYQQMRARSEKKTWFQ